MPSTDATIEKMKEPRLVEMRRAGADALEAVVREMIASDRDTRKAMRSVHPLAEPVIALLKEVNAEAAAKVSGVNIAAAIISGTQLLIIDLARDSGRILRISEGASSRDHKPIAVSALAAMSRNEAARACEEFLDYDALHPDQLGKASNVQRVRLLAVGQAMDTTRDRIRSALVPNDASGWHELTGEQMAERIHNICRQALLLWYLRETISPTDTKPPGDELPAQSTQDAMSFPSQMMAEGGPRQALLRIRWPEEHRSPEYVAAQTGDPVREVRKTLDHLRKVMAADWSDDENAPTMAETLVLDFMVRGPYRRPMTRDEIAALFGDDMVEFFLTQVCGLQRKGLVRG